MAHHHSQFQKEIFKNIKDGEGHTIVIARAGVGKTYSLIEGFKYVPKGLTVLAVAFNKSIAQELAEKAPSYIDTSTLHSLGFKAIKNKFGKVIVSPDKTKDIIIEILKSKGLEKKIDLQFSLDRAVSLCKNYLIESPSKIDELLDDFGIDVCSFDRDEFIKEVIHILMLCKSDTSKVDYNDMIWFPFVFNLSVGKWDRIFIDEVQDLNAAQIHMCMSAAKNNTRIFALGDNFQALYGWRGAERDLIFKLQKKLNAKILLLPITYRCAKNIVKLAREFAPDYQYAPNAKDGEIHYIKDTQLLKLIKPGDFVLSRTNAPLIKYCLAAIKENIPANIAGRDVAAGLIYLLRASKKKTVDSFLKWLENWESVEIKRLTEKKRDISVLLDKMECLRNLCDGNSSVDKVIDKINLLFKETEDNPQVIFSTVHRAKGLERDRCFLLNWTFNSSSQEEKNIKYVAITRAKNEVFFVSKS